jgi:hypothetical protein
MGLVNWLSDVLSTPWHITDEWAKVDSSVVHIVVEEYDAPAWDLKVYYAYKYRNKNTGETRWRLGESKDLGEVHTVFEDPYQKVLTWDALYGSFKSRYLDQDKLYDNS